MLYSRMRAFADIYYLHVFGIAGTNSMIERKMFEYQLRRLGVFDAEHTSHGNNSPKIFLKKKKTKKVVDKYWDWELTNDTQPIRVRFKSLFSVWSMRDEERVSLKIKHIQILLQYYCRLRLLSAVSSRMRIRGADKETHYNSAQCSLCDCGGGRWCSCQL
ncbi:hypothetical protein Tco_1417886 [Tanacetum coccineum]